MLPHPLNKYIDHTLLKPNATQEQFETLLDELIKYDFASVCVSPYMAVPIKAILNSLGHTNLKVCTVVGFPHGNTPTEFKLAEAAYFADRGVDEIDFVLNYGEVKNKQWKAVIHEIVAMGDTCAQQGAVSKCIVETCFLDESEKVELFNYIKDYSQVDFIKTSTGYGTSGATIEDVALWNELRGNSPRPLIKAAGGIRNLETALAMIEAGADRLGMSAGVSVMEEYINGSGS